MFRWLMCGSALDAYIQQNLRLTKKKVYIDFGEY